MIIKSHIRGGYRAAADYLKDIGKNEQIRLVQISDLDAKNLDEAFHNMWTVACNGKCQKPIHHISINPFKDERLTDEQMLKIVARAEQKYGYASNDHQRVIVEHVLNGRQHYHVMWNRVSLTTGKTVWPGEHWKKSKQICREMEKELGLKSPTPRRGKRIVAIMARSLDSGRYGNHRNNRTSFSLFNPKQFHWGLLPKSGRIWAAMTNASQQPQRPAPAIKPNSTSGMSEAQRIDFIAACEGKITWRMYFDKWGDNRPILG